VGIDSLLPTPTRLKGRGIVKEIYRTSVIMGGLSSSYFHENIDYRR